MKPSPKSKAGRKPLGRKPTNITLPPEVKKMGMRAAFEANITFGDYVTSLIRANCDQPAEQNPAPAANIKILPTPAALIAAAERTTN